MNPFRRALLILSAVCLTATFAAAQESVTVELDSFGVGNYFRPSEITAAKVILGNTLGEPTGAWVQWEMPNADGDIAEYGREIALTPGQDAELWLYAPIPPRTDTQSVWSVRVFEYRDGRRLGELGGARISPASANAAQVNIYDDLIAVLHEGDMGLDYYRAGLDPRAGRPMNANELTIPVGRIRPNGMPDRWFGLSAFQVIVWGQQNPDDLGFERSEALREWIRRGGHLVSVLPSAGNPWQLGNQIPDLELADLMPPSAPTEVPDVYFGDLLPVLSKQVDPLVYSQGRFVRNDGRVTIQTFPDVEQATEETNWYAPIMRLPRGDTVAIQRTFGHGRITMIGLPLADGLIDAWGLPQADVFWNEILGRRVDTPTADELTTIDRDLGQLNRGLTRELDLGSGALFSEQINMNREAAAGLLLSLFLFIVYWIIAGPGGFAALKIYKQQQHAWIAFACAAALFTAIAWVGVALTKSSSVQIKHLTFLDRIAQPDGQRDSDQQVERASSWMSIYLPGYGPAEITIESDGTPKDVLHSWETPGVATNPFPNADRYTVDVGRDFATARIPGRATSTQLHAKWLGATGIEFGGIQGRNIKQSIVARRDEGFASGSLLHDFPVAIEQPKIIVVTNRRIPSLRYEQSGGDYLPHVDFNSSGDMRVQAYMWAGPNVWEPGTSWDLTQYRTTGGGARMESEIFREYIQDEQQTGFVGVQGGGQVRNLDQTQRRRYMEMLSLFAQMTPPQYLKQRETDQNNDQVAIYREIGRELDLSPWVVQPCIIMIGYLRGAECPIPITVDGRTPEVDPDSLTVVRWVYPLPLETDIMFGEPIEIQGGETTDE